MLVSRLSNVGSGIPDGSDFMIDRSFFERPGTRHLNLMSVKLKEGYRDRKDRRDVYFYILPISVFVFHIFIKTSKGNKTLIR